VFDRTWIDEQLARLIIQLHQTEGMISLLQQMADYLDGAADKTAPSELTLDDLEALLPEGHKIVGGFEPYEDHVHA
jgi:hypothetical protein